MQILILNEYLRFGSAARYGKFFTYSYSYFNPHYSFLRVPKHRYMNTGLNDTKTCKNGAAGTTCTGTPLTCTDTGYPLNNLYWYALDLYRYKLPTASLYWYRLSCTGTPYGFLPRNVQFLSFSLISHPPIFSNLSHIKNPPWNLPKTTPKVV